MLIRILPIGGINSIRRTVKCINETLSQLVDGVRTVQEDQSKMSTIIDNLATKVNYLFLIAEINYEK